MFAGFPQAAREFSEMLLFFLPGMGRFRRDSRNAASINGQSVCSNFASSRKVGA